MKRFILFGLVAASLSASITFTPLPSTTLYGAPGDVVGWGFTVSNTDPADWAVLTGSSFDGSPVYGTYMDYIATGPSFYVIGPAPEQQTVTQPWDRTNQLGLGEFDIYATDPAGTPIPGTLTLSYDLYSQDPNDPNFDPDISYVGSFTASVSAEVQVTPEPSSFWMLSVLIPAVAVAARRRAAGNR
jgi:hypothetical protein